MGISKRQSFFIAGGALALFFLVGGLFLRGNSKQVPITEVNKAATSNPPSSIPIQTDGANTSQNQELSPAQGIFTMNEFHRSEVKDGKKIWEVSGSKAQYLIQNNAVRIHDADLTLLGKDGKSTQLRTKQATIFLNGTTLSKAHLEDEVVAVYDNLYTLTTSVAECNREENTIQMPSKVKIVGPSFEIQGDTLEGDIDSSVFAMRGDVITILHPRASAGRTTKSTGITP